MELSPSGHTDTFARDHLPPADQWPVLEFTTDDLQYPDRLNAGAALIDDAVARFGPDRPALATPDGEVWTYGELRTRSNQVAQVLVDDLGLVPGHRVLLRSPNTPWTVAAWLGVLKAGGIVVTTFAALRAGELTPIVTRTRPTIALVDHRCATDVVTVRDTSAPQLCVVRVGGDGPDDLVARGGKSGEFEAVATAADDVALFCPTSGSTGTPKITTHFHRDVLSIDNTFGRHVLRLEPTDRVACTAPFAFTFGLGMLVVFPLRAGACAVLTESATPPQLADLVAAAGITVLATAPTAYKQIVAAGVLGKLRGLRAAVSAGEHIPHETWLHLRDQLGLEVIDGIGGTELLHIFISASGDDIRPGATGRPVPGYRAAVLGPDGEELPPGVTGRLAVIGPVGCRYLDDARQRDYVVDGWNVTGDTFSRDEDGYFHYQARTDNMIVSSGYNIGGPEVEAAIDTHPDVVESAVVGEPDPLRGAIVCAFVVLREGVAADAATVRAIQDHVKATIAPYKYPRDVRFVDALPRNTSGKLQHFRLRALLDTEPAVTGATTADREGTTVKIAIVGGGPGGLYFAALMKQLDPAHEITVWERNAADDTFGFGVVFSDETLGSIEGADAVVHERMEREFARWTDIDIEFDGVACTVGGQGFAAMSRKRLLQILQERVEQLGVPVHYRTVAPPVDELRETHDLVLAADGLNSAIRAAHAEVFGPSLDVRHNKYIWLGTDLVFEAFQFFVKQTPFGTMQVHGYPYSDSGSTFIVEMHDDVWRRAGFDRTEHEAFGPGVSDEYAVARIGEIFGEELGDHEILTNNSKWLNFTTVRNEHWYDGNLVLLGDAAHTAHFSIGSGTKLAMEDALALAACLHEHPSVDRALAAYQTERKPVVESTQRAAQASLEWFENIGMYAQQDPVQFCFNLITRSRRITFENLADRDAEFAARIETEFAATRGLDEVAPAMFQPVRIGSLELKNRVIVSPMDMYTADDGVPGPFHLVHLGSKALGGAGLVMTEMVCVSPEGRITPGCTGLWNDAQRDSWREITAFVHEHSTGRIGLQLGHSGRKGSTRLMWDGIDQPLDDGNWEVVAPSALPYGDGCHVPREATRADLDEIVAEFVAAARRGVEAGFDLVEVHAAHGYLLSSFLSPISNRRTDELGGDLTARLRFPLEVFDAVRAVVPAHIPVTVRISATDWAPDGNTEHDAVEIARAFIAHGAAAIDVSSGQVTADEQPAFGRSYQTPFADRIRHEVARPAGVAVIAVGAISSYDDVNSILYAGRADLCALGRSHLYNPQWTLHAAAEQEHRGAGAGWPVQFEAGRRKPPTTRSDKVPPRLALLRDATGPAVHVRWTPTRQPAPV